MGTWIALVVAILGTMLTLRLHQGGVFVWNGFLWSVGALVANGLFIENLGRAVQGKWNRVFWMSLGLVIVGLPALLDDFSGSMPEVGQGVWLFLLVWFAVTTGVLNFYCSFTAGDNLSSVALGVLVLGVTPMIIISSYFMLGKSLGVDQIIGVAITLGAALVFGYALRPNKESGQEK